MTNTPTDILQAFIPEPVLTRQAVYDIAVYVLRHMGGTLETLEWTEGINDESYSLDEAMLHVANCIRVHRDQFASVS